MMQGEAPLHRSMVIHGFHFGVQWLQIFAVHCINPPQASPELAILRACMHVCTLSVEHSLLASPPPDSLAHACLPPPVTLRPACRIAHALLAGHNDRP